MKKFFVFSIIVFIAFFQVGCMGDLEKYYSPIDPESDVFLPFTVYPGASTTGIARNLEEYELIQNANAFIFRTRELEYDGRLQAGEYLLSPAMAIDEMIEKMARGDVHAPTHRVTVPEGYEVRQIVQRFHDQGVADREKMLEVLEYHPFDYWFIEGLDRSLYLEGFLFPATYEIPVGADEVQIVEMMLSQFDRVFNESYQSRLEALEMNIIELITLASIVEREAMVDEEFKLISSVFHNRLNQQMRLESCATVQYILGERKPVLSYADTEIDSAFNTYRRAGLPPSPIASPGLRAIEAALFPAETDYLFFRTTEKNDGTHYFNETYAGHQEDGRRGQ